MRSRRAILDLLKNEGPLDASAMAAKLGVTPMAVRQHLYALQDEALVEYETSARPRGRPAKLWRLTEAANKYFPDAHATLTTDLITAMRSALGEDDFSGVLQTRSKNQRAAYMAELDGIAETGARLKALAEIRTREGYMCHSEKDGEGWLLVEKHCPICVAATACQGLCKTELDLFSAVVGAACRVERTDHIIAGASRCAYRITPRAGRNPQGSA